MNETHDDKDGTIFKKHFQSGQNINIYSLEANHDFVIQHVEHEHLDWDGVEGVIFSEDWTRPLREFVAENYRTLLTAKQIQYLECPEEDFMATYNKVQRCKYRHYISKRITKALIGFNVDYYHRIETRLRQLCFINLFNAEADDNERLSELLKEYIDEPYINELVYERLSCESRQWVVRALLYEIPVKSTVLYEVYDLLMGDLDVIQAEFEENATKVSYNN